MTQEMHGVLLAMQMNDGEGGMRFVSQEKVCIDQSNTIVELQK